MQTNVLMKFEPEHTNKVKGRLRARRLLGLVEEEEKRAAIEPVDKREIQFKRNRNGKIEEGDKRCILWIQLRERLDQALDLLENLHVLAHRTEEALEELVLHIHRQLVASTRVSIE
jgi:hypothetical protein